MGRKCDGPNCKRDLGEEAESYRHAFCSIECACYSGAFSVTKGWIDGKLGTSSSVGLRASVPVARDGGLAESAVDTGSD